MAAKGRVEVQCPHCGNIQLEPELAKSTYCRKCSGYIQIAKGARVPGPLPAGPKEPTLFEKVEGLLVFKGRLSPAALNVTVDERLAVTRLLPFVRFAGRTSISRTTRLLGPIAGRSELEVRY